MKLSRRLEVVGTAALAAAAVVACERYIGPKLRHWGATAAEVEATLPGDEFVPVAGAMVTRGIDVDAPATVVWRWLIQIGVGRGGWYSYDILERAIGVPVHNTDEVREEWQHLSEGDRVVLAPAGWMGSRVGYSMPVVRIERGRSIVLRQQPPEHPWDGVWSFHVVSVDDRRCRLLTRSRTAPAHGTARLAVAVGSMVGDVVSFVMEHRMLQGIKQRAEQEFAADRASGFLRAQPEVEGPVL